LGTWDDLKGQRRHPADLQAVAPRRTTLHGMVAVVVTLVVGVETPVPVGLTTLLLFLDRRFPCLYGLPTQIPFCFHRWHREAKILKQ